MHCVGPLLFMLVTEWMTCRCNNLYERVTIKNGWSVAGFASKKELHRELSQRIIRHAAPLTLGTRIFIMNWWGWAWGSMKRLISAVTASWFDYGNPIWVCKWESSVEPKLSRLLHNATTSRRKHQKLMQWIKEEVINDVDSTLEGKSGRCIRFGSPSHFKAKVSALILCPSRLGSVYEQNDV